MEQIDLHTAYIDHAHTSCHEILYSCNGLSLAGEEASLAFGIDGPWPGDNATGGWINPPGFHARYRGKQFRRHTHLTLGADYCRPAQVAR
jgi:hypothetical protein